MKDEFWMGATFGFISGAMIISLWATYLRDRGRYECDSKLSRSEECIQVWVPPLKEKK